MKPLTDRDRLFLETVHKYMKENNIQTLKDDPEQGYQLTIHYRKTS